MNKTLALVSVIFAVIGAALLVGAAIAGLDARAFLEQAETTTAEVVALDEHRDSDGDVLYRPVFRFTTSAGQVITFRSSTSSAPPAYQMGERIKVGYLAAAPERARDLSWSSLWLLTLILGVLGVVCSAIGGGSFAVRRARAALRARLTRDGRRIETQFQNVQVNAQFAVNGVNPWRIVTQWKNPASGDLHLFQSEDLWFDPSAHIPYRPLIVYLDPENPKKYYMDVSFLPKVVQ